MVVQIVDIDRTTLVTLGGSDDVYVAAGVLLDVAAEAIYGSNSGHTAIIAGQVSGGTYGIILGYDATDSNNSVEIFASGGVYSDSVAILLAGANSNVINRGAIAASYYGIEFITPATSTTNTITNSGTIVSNAAIAHSTTGVDAGQLTIYNSGTIIGFTHSFRTYHSGIERIYNKGRMEGDMLFNGGSDLYDGRGGTFVGTAFGEAGNDTFIGGTGVERFDGGDNNDTFTGGLGKDRITTGIGTDKIIFNALTEIGDIVADFTTTDLFQFKKSAFGNLTLGTLSSATYRENNTGLALDASDRFIMDLDDGRLYYDRDGNGAAARVLVADTNVIFGNFTRADIEII